MSKNSNLSLTYIWWIRAIANLWVGREGGGALIVGAKLWDNFICFVPKLGAVKCTLSFYGCHDAVD